MFAVPIFSIPEVWSDSSLGAFWITKDAKVLHADNEDSDRNARIWVFVWRTCQEVRFLTMSNVLPYTNSTVWIISSASVFLDNFCSIVLCLVLGQTDLSKQCRPRSDAASDLGLHCLLRSVLFDTHPTVFSQITISIKHILVQSLGQA